MEAKVFIGLLTEDSLASSYVLFELGARWGADTGLKPMRAAGLTLSGLRAPLTELNVPSCDLESDLHQMLCEISEELGLRLAGAHLYGPHLKRLLETSQAHTKARSLGSATVLENQPRLSSNDPRIYLEFDPDWGNQVDHLTLSTPILLTNRGGSDAHDVKIRSIVLRATDVAFGKPIPVIAREETRKALPSVGKLSSSFKRNLIWPLNQEWESYQSLAKETLEIPIIVTYNTFDGKTIQTECVLVFDGRISFLNKPGKEQRNPVEFRDYKFTARH